MTTTPKPIEGVILHPAESPGAMVELAEGSNPLDLFLRPEILPAIIKEVETRAKDFVADLTTDKGRKAIASQAYKVSQTKTFLDDLGLQEVTKLKDLPKKVDAARKTMREALDKIRDEVRKPLSDWEAEQEKTKRRLAVIRNTPGDLMTARSNSVCIQNAIETIKAHPTTPEEWGEFAAEAASVQALALSQLEQMLEDTKKRESEAAELERLRKEKAERDRLDREEQLRKEGEARALAAAQQVKPAQVDNMPPTPEQIAAIAPSMAHAAPGLPSHADAVANVEHRRAFNREALADIMDAMVPAFLATPPDECTPTKFFAEAILRAIVTGKIRHIKIEY